MNTTATALRRFHGAGRSLIPCIALIGTFATAQAAPNYTFEDIPLPKQNYVFEGINNKGDIVGSFYPNRDEAYVSFEPTRAFVLSNGTYKTLAGPTYTTTSMVATDINDDGVIVGHYSDEFGLHSFRCQGTGCYSQIGFTTLDPPASVGQANFGFNSIASGINDNGEVIGYYWTGARYNSSLVSFPFIEKDGVYLFPEQPSNTTYYHWAEGINDSGFTAGLYEDDTYTGGQGYIFNRASGVYSGLPAMQVPGFQDPIAAWPRAINDAGQILVWVRDGGDTYVRSGGVYIPIDHPNARSSLHTGSYDINDRGEIVGNYYDGNLTTRGFIAHPISSLGAAIKAKAGAASSRQWDIAVTNSGTQPVEADTKINSLQLTQTYGATCASSVTSSFPIALGDIKAGDSAAGTATINFSGCATTARFKATIQLSSNHGSVTKVLNNQFR